MSKIDGKIVGLVIKKLKNKRYRYIEPNVLFPNGLDKSEFDERALYKMRSDIHAKYSIPNKYGKLKPYTDSDLKMLKNKYEGGGGVGSQVDLFEDYENIPSEVKVILDKYEMEDNDYPVLEEMKQEVEAKGYTFDYGLDAEPYGLRKKGTPINHIRGFEEMEDGGAIEEVVEFTSLEDAEKWSAANQRDEYGIGGFILGSAVGGYVGYKIGRAREMKKGFSTEKRVAKNIKKAIKDRKDKRSQRMYGGRACQCTCCPACNGGWGINTQW